MDFEGRSLAVAPATTVAAFDHADGTLLDAGVVEHLMLVSLDEEAAATLPTDPLARAHALLAWRGGGHR